jgi:hypothetical protein
MLCRQEPLSVKHQSSIVMAGGRGVDEWMIAESTTKHPFGFEEPKGTLRPIRLAENQQRGKI